MVFSRLQIIVEDVVGIVGCNETLHRQTHHLAEQSGRDVAEISARHAYHQLVSLTELLHLGIGVEIVKCLRQETGHIDGIGRSQLHVAVQFLIHESVFHQSLAIVEHAVHFEGGNVLPQCGKLAFLDGTHLAFRIKYIHVDTFHTQKTVGNGTPCITGSSHQHIHLIAPFLLDEVSQKAGHETRPHVFKGQRGTMEKFQGIDVLRHFHHRTVETQRVVHDLFQRIGRHVLSEESVRHAVGHFLKRKVLYLVEERLRKMPDDLGHKQTFVARQAFYYGFVKRSAVGLTVRTIIFHKVWSINVS